MKILCKKRTFSAAGIVLPLIVLALTGCPNKPGGGGGSAPGSPPPVIGNYNAASGTLTVGSVTYMMKQIAGGSGLNLGAGATPATDRNGPHTVDLTTYHIGETEVTQELWIAVMGSNPSWFDGTSGKEPASGEQQIKRPVETVTWFECIDFCNKLTDGIAGLGPSERVYTVSGSGSGKTVTQNLSKKGFRLPTEAEWEWAARGGSTTDLYSGSNTATAVAWHDTISNNRTHQVAQKTANAYGLYDMSGNVSEWCWDWYNTATPTGGINPTGPISGSVRVRRGGAWNRTASQCRCVYRGLGSSNHPGNGDDNIGFRIVWRP